ncbi:DUF4214 domain-containing protein [Massilia luteola]|uniref:DUF4214 domain-containing protein n=1 Tax=Massilia luteola TaxID=3081751 RepID=UPI002ACBEAE0|nr:DUF4214 domain-containing protein [Massilia sp. Gc5]
MTTPTTSLYVRPGWASSAWSYAGVTAVAFDMSTALGQTFARGAMQYSQDGGHTWIAYTMPVDAQGAYVAAAGTMWRFQDSLGSDAAAPETFNVHYKMADGSVVTAVDTVFPDSQPVGAVGSNDIVFTTAHAGDVVDVLQPIDTGDQTGGRWVIDGQSQPGLFAIDYNPAVDTSARLVVADAGLLPADGQAAAVTVHFYDRYQLDTNGNPIAQSGVTQTLTYSIENGTTSDLPGFGNESKAGAALDAYGSSPALATLSGGGFVAVWHGPDTAAGGAGSGLWAQLRDAGGNALGAAFALTPDGDASVEGQPAVSALAGGRFVVAYTLNDGGANEIAYRVVDANGSAGAGHVLDAGASGDASMPTVATLADGSFAVGWRSGAAVHVQQAAADGSLIGAQQVYGALGSAYSPAVAGLKDGGYVVSWGEINDGNVYAASSRAPSAVFVASGDGYAASIATAAPLPHVTALADGGFVVAWDSYANDQLGLSNSDIFFQRFDGSGNKAGAVTQANVDSGGGHDDADVAALADGTFLVAWQGADGDGNGIFGRRFGADGTAIDTQEFAISQLRSGDQASPDVTALAGGGFAGAWVDTSASGVAIEMRTLSGTTGTTGTTGTMTTIQGGTQTAGAGDVATAPASHPVTSTPAASSPVASAPVTGTSATGTSSIGTSATGTSATGTSSTGTSATGTSSTGTSATGTSATGTSATGTSVDSAPAPAAVTSLAFSGATHALAAVAGESKVAGQGGLDTLVYASARAGATIVDDGGSVSVTDAAGNHAILSNVERIAFSDGMVALDVHGTAGEAYRLYQAAFDRTPDKAGLGYWIAAMDKGMSLTQAAAGFTGSAEFANLYGAHASDTQFVQALYQNVLHRAGDSAGADFWMHALASSVTRADVLANFSESTENQAQVIGTIQNGIDYLHWG